MTALSRVSEGFNQMLISVLEEYRLEGLPYRSVEDIYVARFLATGIVGILGKWISDPQPDPKNEVIALMEKILAPLLP